MLGNRYFVVNECFMETAQLREELHKYIDQADDRILRLVKGMFQADSDDYELSEEQQEELDKRLEKYEAGQMNFSSWDTVKNRIRNNTKNAL
jgi:putative addiction module component (TIGR02574 family)